MQKEVNIRERILLGSLAVEVPLLRFPPSVVDALVLQCPTVDPALIPTCIVFILGWHLHGESCGGIVLVV